MNKAIFLDKDGTLVKNIPYNGNPRRITLLPTVAKGLFLLQQREYKLIIITNQSGIAQGFFSLQDLLEVEKSLRRIFLGFFIHIDGFYFCPHHPKGEIALYRQYCWCRKPAPGLIQQAAKDHHIDLRASWMIGDVLDDIETGNRCGCRTILIDNGNETEWDMNEKRIPSYLVPTFERAATIICNSTFVYL